MFRLFVFLAATAAYAAPCITASAECTEWVGLGGGPSRSLIFRTHSLSAPNGRIERVLIMVHGSGRDVENYFRTAVAAAFLAGALEDTVVIAPRIASRDGEGCRDELAGNEVSWPCAGDSWRSGGQATNNDKLTSFDLMDEILRKLARKEAFPNLKAIVVAGHSAGGQYVTRYEMASRVHESLGVEVTYVVSNPSSYAYLDASRPRAGGNTFGRFAGAGACASYDRWPYGLRNRTGYTAGFSAAQLERQLARRPVTYLLGEIDILPLAGFDSSCSAMAQGPTRLARGQAFAAYVNRKFGAHHAVTVVPLCGHNARCMFTADVALGILFPKP
jgi:pimeloyl-ACP methyl ester carboxylesterase